MLDRGVDPNLETQWGKTAIHNAVLSDNAIEFFEAAAGPRSGSDFGGRAL